MKKTTKRLLKVLSKFEKNHKVFYCMGDNINYSDLALLKYHSSKVKAKVKMNKRVLIVTYTIDNKKYQVVYPID